MNTNDTHLGYEYDAEASQRLVSARLPRSDQEEQQENEMKEDRNSESYFDRVLSDALPTTTDWLTEINAYIRKDGDDRKVTHAGMNKKKIHLLPEQEPQFLRFLARDNEQSSANYFTEILTEDGFGFFQDFDILASVELNSELLKEFAKTYQTEVMHKFFPSGNFPLVSFATYGELIPLEGGKTTWKHGMHLIWRTVIVNVFMARKIHAMALANFKRCYPNPTALSLTNSWDDILDPSPYGRGCGLRMPGVDKMGKCPYCKDKRGRREKCGQCKFGQRPIGRPYQPAFCMNEAGKVDEERTESFKNDWRFALEIGTIRYPDVENTRVRGEDFKVPTNAPIAPNELPDQDGDEIPSHDDDVRKGGAVLDAASMREAKRKSKQLDRAASRNPSKLPPSFAPDPVARQRKVTVRPNQQHMAHILQFPWVAERIKKTRNKVMLDRNSNEELFGDLEGILRRSQPQLWQRLHIAAIYTQSKVKPLSYTIEVDGEGSSYCLNREENHASATIYFQINVPESLIHQYCSSKKQVSRTNGTRCADYMSGGLRLHSRIMNALRAAVDAMKPPPKKKNPWLPRFLGGDLGLHPAQEKQKKAQRWASVIGSQEHQLSSEAFGRAVTLNDMLFSLEYRIAPEALVSNVSVEMGDLQLADRVPLPSKRDDYDEDELAPSKENWLYGGKISPAQLLKARPAKTKSGRRRLRKLSSIAPRQDPIFGDDEMIPSDDEDHKQRS